MTILMTPCPFCSSAFMMLETDTRQGQCAQCGKSKMFSDQEIEAAESLRDRLCEKYNGRLQEAYESKDYAKMASLVEEVAMAGISSWYAWFCIGWYDLHEGNTGTAFDDFKLAAMFLDEENFDEFYELTMGAVLDSIEDTIQKDEDWMKEDTTLVEFTGTLFDRFDHLCEDGDFVCDLMLRLGTTEIKTAVMGGNLIKEIMMIVIDYFSGNTFIPDHQTLLNNAIYSAETIDSQMQDMAQDGTLPPNIVKIWGSGFIEYLETIRNYEDGVMERYSEEDAITLSEYWSFNDYETVFSLFQSSFQYHMGYVMSGKRNKGIMKKRDKALDDYSKAFIRPLEEGLTDQDSEYEEDYDRICPDCGKPLTADGSGLIQCECGFKSRIVTDDINNLPENVPELIIMGRKAYEEKDPVMLNNIGERILEFDQENWFGFLTLSSACAADGELAECMMLAVQACEALPQDAVEEFSDRVVDEIGSAMLAVEDQDDMLAGVVIPPFYEAVENSPAKDAGIPMRLVGKLSEGTFDRTAKGFLAAMIFYPTIVYEFTANGSLRHIKEVSEALIVLADRILEGVKAIKNDDSGLKTDTLDVAAVYKELLGYLVQAIDSRTADMGDEKIGYMAGYWKANKDRYEEMVSKLADSFTLDGSPKTTSDKAMKKSKGVIDAFLLAYSKAAEL